jgi:alcohol dehydrogenase (cytochrome c)
MVTRRAAAWSIAASLVIVAAITMPGRGFAAEKDWEFITDERLLNPEPGDWLSYRRTYDVTGFSPL